MRTRIALVSLCLLLGCLSTAEAESPARRSVIRPGAARAGAKQVSTTIFAPHQYVRRLGMIRTPEGTYFDLYSDGRMGIPGRGGAASGSGPIYAPQPHQVTRPENAQAGQKKASADGLSYGDRVVVNGHAGTVISRNTSGGSATVDMGRNGATTLSSYDQVFRRRLDSYGPGATPTYVKWDPVRGHR